MTARGTTAEERFDKRRAAAIVTAHKNRRTREFADVDDYTLHRFQVIRRRCKLSANRMLACLITVAERNKL